MAGSRRSRAIPALLALTEAMRIEIEFATGQYRSDDAYERLDEIRSRVEAFGDELGLAWVEFLSFRISWSALRAEEGREALLRGAEHASSAGQTTLAAFLRGWEGATLVFGRTPVDGGREPDEVDEDLARRRAIVAAVQARNPGGDVTPLTLDDAFSAVWRKAKRDSPAKRAVGPSAWSSPAAMRAQRILG